MHLTQCPDCEREVLEVRTTVLLLSTLPQYEPRRSFCLGQEHARAARRRAAQAAPAWDAGPLPASVAPAAASTSPPPRFTGWLPGLQVAAMVAGVLLLLVTVGDWRGFSGDLAPQQFAAPTAAAGLPTEQLAPAAPAPNAAVLPEADSEQADTTSDGTNLANSASQEMSEQSFSRSAVVSTASTGAAAVTQPLAGVDTAPGAVATVTPGDAESTVSGRGPGSRLRLVQIALFAILAWLVVTIVGLRWVRRLRES
jgi:ferric-dicitrate binding protein FerR (iron transport regulator)